MNIKDVIKYVQEEYGVVPEYPWKDYPGDGTFKDKLSGKWFAVFMKVRADKIGLSQGFNGEYVDIIDVKADPDFILLNAGRNGYYPGYHMNKRHWITLVLESGNDAGCILSDDEIKNCIDRSYRMITDTPTRRIYEAVKKIPKGKVATYGQVAFMAGDKKMARAVGNALHKNPDPDNIPCFRVVNSKGELAGEFAFGGPGAQAKLLEKEGIEVVDGKVDILKYGIEV